jgi:hypothetical protein
VIVASEGNPMTDLAGKVQWFDPFEIRRPKSLLEVTLRIGQGAGAMLVLVGSLEAFFAIGVLPALRGERLGPRWGDFIALSLLAVLGSLVIFTAARRYAYWRVNQAGIHQYWFGFKNWSLAWNEIVSRQLGPFGNAWFFFLLIPILGGPHQAIVLDDRRGRKRKVNRLATNGLRLDAMLRHLLDAPEELRRARTFEHAMEIARAIHFRQDPAKVPLRYATRDAPVVRMKLHEPSLLRICCNCLGSMACVAPIAMSPGLAGFLNPRFEPFFIPLCSACHTRTRRSRLGEIAAVVVAFVCIVVGMFFCTLPSVAQAPWGSAVSVALGVAFFLGAVFVLWKQVRRPSPDKLVKVVGASSRGGWIDVRFGNPDYARLVDELNGWNPKSAAQRATAPDSKAAIFASAQEL